MTENRRSWTQTAVTRTAVTRTAVLTFAGLLGAFACLGPLLLFLLGDRLEHCAPNGEQEPFQSSYTYNQSLAVSLSGPTSFIDPTWQLAAAKHLSAKWELHHLRFVAIADHSTDVRDVGTYTHALVVAVIDGPPPKRRQEARPYLSSSPGEVIAATLPLMSINKAALGFEKALGRRLFPLTLEVADLPGKAHQLSPPFAIYDVSSGRITVEAALVRQMGQLTDLPGGMAAIAEALFSQISRFPSLKATSDLAQVANVVLSAATSAVTFAIAYQVPLWFCIACPVVLGMLAPFVINGGLALLASAVCSHWRLPTEECTDLWYGVFAAGMVLSLASAIPIVFLCKLPQCAHRHRV